jgi:hypothetical protein
MQAKRARGRRSAGRVSSKPVVETTPIPYALFPPSCLTASRGISQRGVPGLDWRGQRPNKKPSSNSRKSQPWRSSQSLLLPSPITAFEPASTPAPTPGSTVGLSAGGSLKRETPAVRSGGFVHPRTPSGWTGGRPRASNGGWKAWVPGAGICTALGGRVGCAGLVFLPDTKPGYWRRASGSAPFRGLSFGHARII